MSGLEVPAFIIGVASVFTSCVDAFAYFKAAQRADTDIEKLLLKLDIEKTRLLVWGNESGIFSVNQQHSNLRNESTVTLLGRILTQIEELLTDAERLRFYGLRVPETPLGEAIDYVSSNSLAIFRASMSRFWTRNASRLSTTVRRSAIARTRWAIYEREKFQGLVNDVKEFVDRVYELVPVDRETQDMIIVADIEAILDISRLRIVEAATEDSYRVYSQAASSVITSAEAETVDRRTVEERLRDTELTQPNPTTQAQAWDPVSSSASDALLEELRHYVKHFVLTSECHKRHSPSPCDTLQLGSQAASYARYPPDAQWDVSSRNEKGGNTLWQLTNRLIRINSTVEDLKEEDNLIGTLLKESEYSLTEAQRGFLNTLLPLITVFIYCSPCICLIHTAFTICNNVSSPFVAISIRPDDRLISSCCTNTNRVLGLRSILEWVREWEAKATTLDSCEMARFLDRIWVERRLDHFDEEKPYTFEEDGKCRAIIIGEADYLSPLLQKAPGRIPRAMDIWDLTDLYGGGYVRRFNFRFIESHRVAAQKTERTGGLNASIGGQQVEREAPVLKRPSSSMSSDSKRQKELVAAGNQGEETED
ncbi:prion-inhibition and propagation-domain-containing protein [Stachybotrys elegans]|uniref:Prion-inhibition and propagation-domain-containing protein n=1 Tax=Stachybotrys elegans TaxID=80388 RepID=A0A8K0WJS1_9HYPO|nr:prion-inhibition and propagation-domain-containing protein [Stachybotrys elegans]